MPGRDNVLVRDQEHFAGSQLRRQFAQAVNTVNAENQTRAGVRVETDESSHEGVDEKWLLVNGRRLKIHGRRTDRRDHQP
jgi:hypothetical protein